jgi:hypothetical protein
VGFVFVCAALQACAERQRGFRLMHKNTKNGKMIFKTRAEGNPIKVILS